MILSTVYDELTDSSESVWKVVYGRESCDYVQEDGTYCDGSLEHAVQGNVSAAAVPFRCSGYF